MRSKRSLRQERDKRGDGKYTDLRFYRAISGVLHNLAELKYLVNLLKRVSSNFAILRFSSSKA